MLSSQTLLLQVARVRSQSESDCFDPSIRHIFEGERLMSPNFLLVFTAWKFVKIDATPGLETQSRP